MEIVNFILLGILVIEELYICKLLKTTDELSKQNKMVDELLERIRKLEYKEEEEPEEEKEDARKRVYGTFQNPLGDTYRKNTRNQYVPIKPNAKMLDGLGDDDE